MVRLRPLLLVLATSLAVVLTGSLPAHAEDGFRFWGYYTWTGQSWTFAPLGIQEHIPADGSVTGWRHAVSGNTPRYPRAIGDFELICAGVPDESDRKQIAVIIDYGTYQDALDETVPGPTGTCVVAPMDATALDLLHATAELRTSGNHVCAVNGFPSSGCGTAVSDIEVPVDEDPVDLTITDPVGSNRWDPSTAPVEERATTTPEPQPPTDNTGSWQNVLVGGGMLVIIAGTGFYLTRRRQRG